MDFSAHMYLRPLDSLKDIPELVIHRLIGWGISKDYMFPIW